GLDLAQLRQAPEGLDLDLADALSRQPETAADLLERLRLLVGEAVAQENHLPLAIRQGRGRLSECLTAQRSLHLLVGERALAGHEIPEDCVVLIADRLVKARGGTGRRSHLARLLDGQA